MRESPLPGGSVNRWSVSVTRCAAGRRRAQLVHALLGLFERVGWDGAPRLRGIDEQGREMLSFLDGHVAWEPIQPAAVGCDESLSRVAKLVREFHDLTAGTALAGDEEVTSAWPGVADFVAAARRVRLIRDAYGLAERDGLVDAILWWQDRCWRDIEAAALAGDLAMVRLRVAGVVDDVRAAYRWVERHRAELAAEAVAGGEGRVKDSARPGRTTIPPM